MRHIILRNSPSVWDGLRAWGGSWAADTQDWVEEIENATHEFDRCGGSQSSGRKS